jgi:hypothetical protein
MKSLDNLKIAVCFVGQSRRFKECSESINRFFSSTRGNKFTFFGHSWDTNIYKTKKDNKIVMVEERDLDRTKLSAELKSHFNLQDLVVDVETFNPNIWGYVFYSTMISNFLKQKYEAENNMMFDLVIKARYDIRYPDGLTFEIAWGDRPVEEKTLYSYLGFMNPEFYLPNIDDVHYCGTSMTMDIIDSLYNALMTDTFVKITRTSESNPSFNRVGPGAIIYKWATLKNILPRHLSFDYAVHRYDTPSGASYDEVKYFSNLMY